MGNEILFLGQEGCFFYPLATIARESYNGCTGKSLKLHFIHSLFKAHFERPVASEIIFEDTEKKEQIHHC